MAFSSGTFTFTSNSFAPSPTLNTVISETAAASTWSELETALSTAVLKDGTQTITANLPMGGFKLTGLAAGSAAGNSVRWEQTAPGLMTTLGDTIYASAANTAARLPATADVAANATTSNIWGAREIILTGGAVTFTDIADAPYVGAVAWVKQNAAHVWTDGAVFNVQGGANYTAAADDWIRVYATTVSTFEVTIFTAALTPFVDTNPVVIGGTDATKKLRFEVDGLTTATTRTITVPDANLTLPTVTSQALQEAATDNSVYVTSGLQQFHPSAAKAWGEAGVTGNLVIGYNIASVIDDAVGQISYVIGTDMSSVNYVINYTFEATAFNGMSRISLIAAGSFQISVVNAAGSLTDPISHHAAAFGDQA